jgi:hypothetical protein
VTGDGSQGVTVDHGICVVEPASTRAGIYVGIARGRDRNVAWIVDGTGAEDAEDLLADRIARPTPSLSAHGVREQLHRAQGKAIELDEAQRMIERMARPQSSRALPLRCSEPRNRVGRWQQNRRRLNDPGVRPVSPYVHRPTEGLTCGSVRPKVTRREQLRGPSARRWVLSPR